MFQTDFGQFQTGLSVFRPLSGEGVFLVEVRAPRVSYGKSTFGMYRLSGVCASGRKKNEKTTVSDKVYALIASSTKNKGILTRPQCY